MKAIIKIGKVTCKFEVPDSELNVAPAVTLEQHEKHKYEFMQKAKRIAIDCYRETKRET